MPIDSQWLLLMDYDDNHDWRFIDDNLSWLMTDDNDHKWRFIMIDNDRTWMTTDWLVDWLIDHKHDHDYNSLRAI